MSVETEGRKGVSSRTLVVGVLAMTVVVLALGGTVVAVRLRPESLPTNSTDRSVAAWEQLVEDAPEDSSARTGLGIALLDAGRDGDARKAFEDAIALNEENWVALLELGVLVWEVNPTRATSLLDDAVKYAPRRSKVTPAVALGDLQLELGELEAAIKAYRVAVADAPFVLEGHLGLAKAYEESGATKKAVKEYRSAARFAPDDPEIVAGLERLGADT